MTMYIDVIDAELTFVLIKIQSYHIRRYLVFKSLIYIHTIS